MDLNPNEVSRLLEYAAAMSAAQEKVTGSSKLAMAKTRGEAGDTRIKSDINGDVKVKTQAPQQSFLHNKFKKVEEMKPVHIPITVEKKEEKVKEERGQVVRAERVTVKEDEQGMTSSSWSSEKRSESARSSFSSAKSVFSSDDKNDSVKSSLPPIKIGISNNNSNNVNNNYENVQVVDSPKPALPPRNPIWANKNNVDKDICNPKPSPVMNARTHSGILTKSSLDNMTSKEMKVQERDGDDDSMKHQVPALKSSLGVAKFIRQANITGCSEETVQQTQYQNEENIAQHATKPVAEAKRMFENNAKSLMKEARLPRGGSQQ